MASERSSAKNDQSKTVIAQIYLVIERLLLFFQNGIATLVQGVGLGLLNSDQLQQITQQRYLGQSHMYSTESYLNSGLFLWERESVRRYFPPRGHILVAAAGAGREMFALAGCGFSADGFDCCPPLVAAGREFLRKSGIEAKLELVAPSAVPDGPRQYDAVMIGFSGYMYIPGRERRVEFLRRLGGFLTPGAPLMMSFVEGGPGNRRFWTARIGNALRRLRNGEPVEEGDCLRAGFQHHFVEEQIDQEMNAAGFDLVYYSGGTTYGHAVGLRRDAK